jgi:hypothetical protein
MKKILLFMCGVSMIGGACFGSARSFDFRLLVPKTKWTQAQASQQVGLFLQSTRNNFDWEFLPAKTFASNYSSIQGPRDFFKSDFAERLPVGTAIHYVIRGNSKVYKKQGEGRNGAWQEQRSLSAGAVDGDPAGAGSGVGGLAGRGSAGALAVAGSNPPAPVVPVPKPDLLTSTPTASVSGVDGLTGGGASAGALAVAGSNPPIPVANLHGHSTHTPAADHEEHLGNPPHQQGLITIPLLVANQDDSASQVSSAPYQLLTSDESQRPSAAPSSVSAVSRFNTRQKIGMGVGGTGAGVAAGSLLYTVIQSVKTKERRRLMRIAMDRIFGGSLTPLSAREERIIRSLYRDLGIGAAGVVAGATGAGVGAWMYRKKNAASKAA